jgi:hypothetical protein
VEKVGQVDDVLLISSHCNPAARDGDPVSGNYGGDGLRVFAAGLPWQFYRVSFGLRRREQVQA